MVWLCGRIHPTMGANIDFDDDEKKGMIIVEGGEDIKKPIQSWCWMTPWLSLAISILLFVSEPNSHIEAKWHHKLVQLSFPHLPPTVMLPYAPPPPSSN